MNLLKTFYKKIIFLFIPNYISELGRELKRCNSLLDLGCGDSSPISFISERPYSVGVDSFPLSIEKSKKKKIHNKYYQLNVLEIGRKFKDNSFDCVLALDLIEHLKKDEGIKLLNIMEKIAKKKVIVFTPNGFLKQSLLKDNNPWQRHKSGWEVNEMRNKGYSVKGISGLKFIRGERAKIKLKPIIFWTIISDISQLFIKSFPKYAFQIFCVKSK